MAGKERELGKETGKEASEKEPIRVGLFVTCLVDLFRPSVGFATISLLEDAGCRVEVPMAQSCCGQPAYNSGDEDTAGDIARNVISSFEHFDYVVAPSGSCAAMIKEHYPELLAKDPAWSERAESMASRCHELLSFLVDVRNFRLPPQHVEFDAQYTYHDSCSGLRELGVHQQPRELLKGVEGLKLKEMKDSNVCCGFGGTFCIKYPEISSRMVMDKTVNIHTADADTLLGGDLGCLMNIAGRLSRENSPVRVYHVAEVLTGMTETTAPIAANKKSLNEN